MTDNVTVDISVFELHNMMRSPAGLRTRKALASVKTPTTNCVYVGAFTVESPSTTEPLHYLFEQDTTSGFVTLRAYTEEFVEFFNYALGNLQDNPVITCGVQNAQLMINSPAFSTPLYGQVGGGLISAVKVPSINPDTTALDIPNGHICTFGDRFCIAQGNVLFFNDPGTDPRTFVAENAVAMPGSIYDVFQGADGSLYIFTSAGVFSLSSDALGQGQTVVGFIARVPGINTSRSRNACASNGANVVLQKDRVVLLSGAQQQAIDLSPYKGRRSFSPAVAVDDLRLAAELHPTPEGFIVGFRGKRGHYLVASLKDQSFHYVWSSTSAFNVVGTLRSRDGEALVVLKDRVVMPVSSKTDYDGGTVQGVACGRLPAGLTDNPVIRRVTMGAANIGSNVGVYVSGNRKTATTPTTAKDTLIGTSLWSASTAFAGRQTRTVRHSFDIRTTDPNVEIFVEGGDRRVLPSIEVEVNGQGRGRSDKDG